MVAPLNPGMPFRSKGLTKVSPYGSSSKTPSFIIEKGPGWGPFAVSNRVALLALSEDGGGDSRYAAARVVGDVRGVEAEAASLPQLFSTFQRLDRKSVV